MKDLINNSRQTMAEVDSMFYDRWSPRSFIYEKLSDEQIDSLFEAARWSPSCFNEQPWFFVYAVSNDARKRFLTVLTPKNQLWAQHASMLIFVCTRLCFQKNNKENKHAAFDAGAAWMALALQARKLALYAHAMAGFDKEKAFNLIRLPQNVYDIIAAVAVGKRGPADRLVDKDMRAMEHPNNRKPLSEICRPQSV